MPTTVAPPSLKRGSTGNDVRTVQGLLKSRYSPKALVTGYFGKLTETLVLGFQKIKGLKPDGVVGPITLRALTNAPTLVALPIKELKSMNSVTEAILMDTLGLGNDMATTVCPAINLAMSKYDINTTARVAMFIANVAHESGNFARMVENLNYSAEGLRNTWPSRFSTTGDAGGDPNELAQKLARNPQAIANTVYADRGGNGDASSGDGWKYRGRGPIGVTFCDNYQSIGDKLGLDLVNQPELLEDYPAGFEAAAIFVVDNNVQQYADRGDFDGYCDKINIGRKTQKIGDAVGYADRRAKFAKLMDALS